MVPFVGTDVRLSEITIANLEDFGYEVDYSAADPFDTFGEGCRCGSNERRMTERSILPQLSSEGLDFARSYARGILDSVESLFVSRSFSSSNEWSFKDTPAVEIYYAENDQVFSIEFEQGDV